MEPKTIYLKDYTPPVYEFDSVHLTFDLNETTTHVEAVYQIHRKEEASSDAPLELFGRSLKLTSLQLDGKTLSSDEYQLDEEKLVLKNLPASFKLIVKTEISPKENKALMGLYVSRGIFCTQCEAEGFRRITYFADRPDVLSRYTTKIIADKKRYPVLLSNGNLTGQGQLPGGRHWVVWEDPFKKPSYLFALVAGNLEHIEDHFLTKNGRKVTLKVFAEEGEKEKCHHALESLKKAMKWDEETYGREYDLDIYMIVAINDFNMGAMENKGLNIFNSKYILVNPETATDQDYEAVLVVVGHEYFHNWSGNRVTCRDWFQLSLKEGLTVFREQEFTEDMTSAAIARIDRVNLLRTQQFPEDAGPLAHPVQPSSYIEINNFYTMTVYNKGAEVIRMIKTLIGKEVFRRGMDIYFQKYDGQAVTIEEFVSAMEAASGRDLKQFRLWYTQAGTPKVEVQSDYDEGQKILKLKMIQTCLPTPGQLEKKPFHFPVAMGILNEEEGLPKSFLLEMKEAEQIFEFKSLPKPRALSLFRSFSAPVKWQDAATEDTLKFLLLHDSDAFNRWEAWQKIASRKLLQKMDPDRLSSTIDPEVLFATQKSSYIVSDSSPFPFAELFKTLIAQERDRSFLAELLTLPSEAYLSEFMTVINVDGIHASREEALKQIGQDLTPEWLKLYEENQTPGKYSIEKEAIAKRRLKNLALSYLVASGDEAMLALAYQQFCDANNMTDRLGALAPMAHVENKLTEKALQDFYARWKHEPLVMDKWLAIHAASKRPGTLQRIQKLIHDPVFDSENPNRVRAVFGTFSRNNRVQFHVLSGEGYELLKDQIIKSDRFNPQLAAQLLGPFSQWRNFDETRQSLMCIQLETILKEKKLSKDVFELVSKSLL